MNRRLQKVWNWSHQAAAIAGLVFLFADLADAQNSKFTADASGNHLTQTSESIALPQIIAEPLDQIIIPGHTASFSVLVADTRGVSYQWFFNSGVIPGATTDSLLLTNVSTNNAGLYSVTVSNASGAVPSSSANLYIDSDGDGLPDSWEIANFGGLNQTATGDPDGDGVSNLQEFFDGTNPTNNASVLYRITLINDGGVVTAVPNQSAYTKGQVVTLTATGSGAFPFHAWTGDVVTRSNSITVTMNTNLTLFAHFLPFTLNWTNTFSGDWNVAANWTPNLAPASNESAVIPIAVTVTLNSNVDLVDFSFGAASVGPELTGTGRLTISGTGSWSGGTMSGSGATVVRPGGSFTIANAAPLTLNGRTFENQGLTIWSSGGNLNATGGVFTNDAGAQFQVLNPAAFNFGGGAPRFDNAGTFLTASNGASAFNGVAFNNYGSVPIQGGTFSMSGGGLNNGSMTVPAGTTLSFAGGAFSSSGNSSITGAGTLLINANSATLAGTINVAGSNVFSSGAVDFTGNYTCTNNTMYISGGAFSFDGTGVVMPAVLNLSGTGTLGGAQNVSVGSAMNWTGGAMAGSGRTSIPPGATLTVTSPSFISLTSRTLDNGGTTFWSAPTLSFNGGVITNEPGALFQMQSPSALNFGGGSPRFDNAGTFRVTGSGTVSLSGVAMNNFNTVDIQTGTLALSGGGTHTGVMTVPVGTTLNFGGGNFTSSIGSSITGAGTFMVSGGNSTLAGTINVTGSNVFSNGFVDFTGNYICTNNTMLISGAASFDGTGVVAPAVLNLNGALGGAQTVSVTSAMNWTGGSMNDSGRTVIPPGATLTIANPSFMTIINRTLDNGGTTLWTGAGNLNMNGGVITNRAGALFNAQNSSGIFFGGGAPRFDNAGTFRKSVSAGTTTLGGVAMNNFNTVDIQTGTLALSGGGTHTGVMTVPVGTTLNFGGGNFTSSAGSSITGAGTFMVSGGNSTLAGTINVTGSNVFSNGFVDFTGNYICTNNTMLISGAASFDGTGVVAPAVLNLNGALGGAQTVSATTAMSWTGGSMNDSGRTVIPPGATLTIANPSFMTINNRTLDNGGTTLWTSAAIINLNAAVITNRPGALFNAQTASAFNYGGGAPRFDNAGTFRKSLSVGTTTIGGSVGFNNYGTVDIRSGFLAANGGYGSSSNSVLNCALWGKLPGINYGQLQVSGSVTLNGTLSINVTNHFIPATNDTYTVLTAGVRNGTFANFVYPSNNVTMVLSNGAASEVVRITGVMLQPTNPLPAAPGIISWWRAESNALDSAGSNNGTLTNGTAFTAGKVGQSFLLDGIDDYVAIPDSPSLHPSSITLEAWVQFNATNGFRLIMGKPIGSGILDSFALWLADGVLNGVICDAVNGGPSISYTMLPVIGQWYHLAYTYDGATLQQVLYVNGAALAVGTGYQGVGYDNHPMLIGSDIDNGIPDGFFSGQIDEATIYNRALGPDEIASIYNAGSAGKQLVQASRPVLHLDPISATAGRLYWSTNFPGYHLEYNARLGSTNWAASGLKPVVTGTNFVVTNSLSGAQRFYRLSSVPSSFTPRPPILKIQLISTGLVRLLWPVDTEQTFRLQSTTNLTAVNWPTVLPAPSIMGTNNVVTNAIIGSRQFYRLAAP